MAYSLLMIIASPISGMIADTLGNQWAFGALGLELLVLTLANCAIYRLIFRKNTT